MADSKEFYGPCIKKAVEYIHETEKNLKPQLKASANYELMYTDICKRWESALLLRQKAKQKEDENLHRQLEETRVIVEKEKSSVKKEEEEIVLLKQTLEKLKAQQDELTNKVSICKEKIGDAEKELVSLHKEIHDRETAPLSEKSQLDFLRGLSRCKIVTTSEESAIKGYVVRRKGTESNELRTFSFDTATEPKHYILNRLWNLIEWSYEEDLKLYL